LTKNTILTEQEKNRSARTKIEKAIVKKDSSSNFPLTVNDEKKETSEKENVPAVIKTETPILPKKEIPGTSLNSNPKMKEP